MDHIRELQGRLFAVALTFLVVAAAAFPFFDTVVKLIVAPLGKDQELVYLTPGGAISFMIQVCAFVGIIGALPVLIYHIYRFIMPVVKRVHLRRALGFTVVSFLLAASGVVFAYLVSLPAAIYFLTSFNLSHINPMLTVDSYLSFVMTYLLAGALLFQLPLVMMIINNIKPLSPRKLMGYQDKTVLSSFIAAAVISPTPDALNQTLLAAPIIVMYQVGILLVWWKNRSTRKTVQAANKTALAQTSPTVITPQLVSEQELVQKARLAQQFSAVNPVVESITTAPQVSPAEPRMYKAIDGFVVQPRSLQPAPRKIVLDSRPSLTVSQRPLHNHTVRGIDGFFVPLRG